MVEPKHPHPKKENIDNDLHAMEVMDKMRVKYLISRLRDIPSEGEFKITLELLRKEERELLEAHVPKLDEKFINDKCEEVVQMAREELVELKTKALQSYISFHHNNIHDLAKKTDVCFVSPNVINYLHEANNITLDDLERLKNLIKEEGLSNSKIDPYAEDGFIKTAERIIKSANEMAFLDSPQEPKKTPRVR